MRYDGPVKRRRAPKRNARSYAAQVAALRRRVQGQLPDIDPHDLDLILLCMVRPFGSGRRYFLREIRPNVYVA